MVKRICGKCKKEKELNEDNFKLYLGKLTKWCQICLDKEKEKRNNETEEKKENEKRRKKEWNKNNPDKVKARKERQKCKEHNIRFCIKCPTHRKPTIDRNLKCRAKLEFKKRDIEWDVKEFYKYLGCSTDIFISYIESLMKKKELIWENYGCEIGKWCFDHIKPLHPIDNKIDNDEFLNRLHYSNIQPMLFLDNSNSAS